MDESKFKEFIGKVGAKKAKEAFKAAEQIEERAEELGIASKEKKPDQPVLIGDLTLDDFMMRLRGAVAEIVAGSKKTAESGPAKKRPGKTRLSNQKRPGDQAPLTRKGIIDPGFEAFIAPALATKSKDGSKGHKKQGPTIAEIFDRIGLG